MHLVMCLDLNKHSYTKEGKKEEESKKIRRSGADLKKILGHLSIRVNLK